jgi:hypothetical protein
MLRKLHTTYGFQNKHSGQYFEKSNTLTETNHNEELYYLYPPRFIRAIM